MAGRDQTIQYLTQKKKELTEKREKLMRPVVDVERELSAVTLTLSVVLREEAVSTVEIGFPLRKLKNMTQTQALVEIANFNGGELKCLDAKAILVNAKLMKNSRNAARMVNGTINRSGLFDRVSRGVYRLKALGEVAMTDADKETMNQLFGNEQSSIKPLQ